jgi:hypothetical protein
LLGFRPDHVRILPTDSEHRLRIDALFGAIEADARRGHQPLTVAANAGATNTGAVDRLGELAEICRKPGLWLQLWTSMSRRSARSLCSPTCGVRSAGLVGARTETSERCNALVIRCSRRGRARGRHVVGECPRQLEQDVCSAFGI